MKNWVSLIKLIQIPTSIGTMWISSSSRIAGRTSRYGVARSPSWRRRRRAGGTVPTARLVGVVVVTRTGLSLPGCRPRPREAAADRERCLRSASAAGGGHLVLGLLQRGLDVAGADVLAGGCLGEQTVDGVADVSLEGGLCGNERERVGRRGPALGERAGAARPWWPGPARAHRPRPCCQ